MDKKTRSCHPNLFSFKVIQIQLMFFNSIITTFKISNYESLLRARGKVRFSWEMCISKYIMQLQTSNFWPLVHRHLIRFQFWEWSTEKKLHICPAKLLTENSFTSSRIIIHKQAPVRYKIHLYFHEKKNQLHLQTE